MANDNVGAQVAFLRTVSGAFSDLADALLRGANEEQQEELQVGDVARHPSEDRELGRRQKQIVELSGLSSEDGIKTSEIAKAINYEVPNTYMTLRGLSGSDVVELIPGSHPQRWRLTARYRRGAGEYGRIASLVNAGEWTTYGDVSIAVRGDNKAARAVGRAAAVVSGFPHPHRVLMEGGFISEHWLDSAGRGPEECRRRLDEEGVRFDEVGRADPSQRVAWDELRRRAARADDPLNEVSDDPL